MSRPLRLVLDTNVFASAVFFAGTPAVILEAWKAKRVEFIVSREILGEYRRTGEKLKKEFRADAFDLWMELFEQYAVVVSPAPLPKQVCTDSDDDMFIACALASGAKVICSGDKALLATSGYCGIEVLKPRAFVDKYLD